MKIIEKPWGREIWWAHVNTKYLGKILEIKNGHQLSLQYHQIKEETIYVLKGSLTLFHAEQRSGQIKKEVLVEGETFHVRPLAIHRFAAETGDVTLIEVSTDFPEDVVRLEDDYNRYNDINME